MQTDKSVDAPQDAIKWSKNIFRTRVAERKPGLVERIIGVLSQELVPGKAAFGERSGTAGRMRQMLFEAGDNRVDLRVSPKAGKFDVRGQILGRGWEGSSITFAKQECGADKFGGFVFNEIEEGTYDLTISGERIEIVLKGIVLE